MQNIRYLPELSRAEMAELLRVERVGRIGLNDGPQPYVVPTDFAYREDAIYIHSPANGKKSMLARRDPHVCFEVDSYNDDLTEYKSVIVRGRIVEILDEIEKKGAMHIIAAKAARPGRGRIHADGGPSMGDITVFKITIKEMTGIKSPGNGHP